MGGQGKVAWSKILSPIRAGRMTRGGGWRKNWTCGSNEQPRIRNSLTVEKAGRKRQKHPGSQAQGTLDARAILCPTSLQRTKGQRRRGERPRVTVRTAGSILAGAGQKWPRKRTRVDSPTTPGRRAPQEAYGFSGWAGTPRQKLGGPKRPGQKPPWMEARQSGQREKPASRRSSGKTERRLARKG